MLPRFRATTLVAVLGVGALPRTALDPTPIRGFSPEYARVPREWEAKFKAIPEPARMPEAMRRLSARPHHVGAAYAAQNAEWRRDQFRLHGWQAEIERFDVLFPTPIERVVVLVAPTTFRAKLEDPALAEDATSGQKAGPLPMHEAYGVDATSPGRWCSSTTGCPPTTTNWSGAA